MSKIFKRTYVEHNNKFAKPWAPQPTPKRLTLTAESSGIHSLWVRKSGFIGQDPWYGKNTESSREFRVPIADRCRT